MTNLATVISDIHLQPDQPDHPINQAFLKFLYEVAPHSEKLYILGDLFELWLGDDIGLQQFASEIQALKQLNDSGTQIYIQYGNRDFLMRRAFTQAIGAQLLPDEYPAEIGAHKLLMVHGDQLCTEDHQYQKMRRWFRNPVIQWLFLHLPRKKRLAIGLKMRNESEQAGHNKSPQQMDVTETAVKELFDKHPGYRILIHGHTHKPAVHQYHFQGKDYQRYVLSDWRPQSNYLSVTGQAIEIHDLK